MLGRIVARSRQCHHHGSRQEETVGAFDGRGARSHSTAYLGAWRGRADISPLKSVLSAHLNFAGTRA